MATINYTQTDTAPTCTTGGGGSGFCSPASTNRATPVLAVGGGTAGTSTPQIAAQSSESNIIGAQFEIQPSASTTWNSGTWTVRINITTANMNLTWTAVYICRVNSSCTNQATIGSATGLNISLGTTGVKSTTVSGSAQTPSAGDIVLVLLLISNGAMSLQTANLTANQNIDSPFTAVVDVTVNATGSSITSSVGSVTATPGITVNLTGNSAAFSIGSTSITGDANLTPSGSSISASIGNPSITGDANISLSGLSITSASGTVTVSTGVDVTVAVTGNSMTASAGNVSVAGDANVALTGTALLGSIGVTTITGTANVAVSGSAMTITSGTVTATGGGAAFLSRLTILGAG